MPGIGVDIEEVSRFRGKPISENKEFYERLFTLSEMGYCLEFEDPYPHVCARFCAKEAFMKAKGTRLDFLCMEVVKKGEKPFVKFEDALHDLSISHTNDHAIAFVIL